MGSQSVPALLVYCECELSKSETFYEEYIFLVIERSDYSSTWTWTCGLHEQSRESKCPRLILPSELSLSDCLTAGAPPVLPPVWELFGSDRHFLWFFIVLIHFKHHVIIYRRTSNTWVVWTGEWSKSKTTSCTSMQLAIDKVHLATLK